MAKESATTTHKSNMQKAREKLAENARDDRWLSLKADEKRKVRILPAWTDKGPYAGMWFFDGGLHYGFKIGGFPRALACPQYANKGDCPVCMMLEAIDRAGEDKELQITASRIKRKIRHWVNCIDRANPTKVLMYGSGYDATRTLWTKTLMDQADEDEYGDFTDPTEGRDVSFSREGSGIMDTKYKYRLLSEVKPIGLKGWQKMLHPLDQEVLEWMSFDEMVQHLKSNYGETLGELGLTFKASKQKPTKKAKPIEEEEEEVEEVEEVEEEEEKEDEESESEDDADADEDEEQEEDDDDEE